MKVLCICQFGMNRSRYLAEYLATLGYDTFYGGVREREVLQEKINKADILVSAAPDVTDDLHTFNLGDRKVIALDVDDKTNSLTGDDWCNFQSTSVYPRLKAQIDKHLPLKI